MNIFCSVFLTIFLPQVTVFGCFNVVTFHQLWEGNFVTPL
jgi:hypothetical protein